MNVNEGVDCSPHDVAPLPSSTGTATEVVLGTFWAIEWENGDILNMASKEDALDYIKTDGERTKVVALLECQIIKRLSPFG